MSFTDLLISANLISFLTLDVIIQRYVEIEGGLSETTETGADSAGSRAARHATLDDNDHAAAFRLRVHSWTARGIPHVFKTSGSPRLSDKSSLQQRNLGSRVPVMVAHTKIRGCNAP